MFIEDFINDNFVTPLCRYYTTVGTITYGIILILVVWGTYKLLRRLRIKIDKRFFIGLLPFIIYGGWTRALRDHMLGIYQSNLFCSPPIYFFIFAVTWASILLGLFIEKRTKKKYTYDKTQCNCHNILLFHEIHEIAYHAHLNHLELILVALFKSIIFWSFGTLQGLFSKDRELSVLFCSSRIPF